MKGFASFWLSAGPCIPCVILLSAIIPSALASSDFIPFMGDDIHNMVMSRPLIVLASGSGATFCSFLLENPSGNAGFLGEGFLNDASGYFNSAFGLPLLAASACTWGIGSLADSPGTEMTGQMLTEGMILSYGFTGILKLGTGRMRPDGSNSRSFPSAHAAGTACCAVILWDRYGAGAGIPAAAVAAFTSLSRVHAGAHFPSDVIAGATIGIAAGLAVVESHEESASGDHVYPAMGLRWSSQSGFGVYF